MWQKNLATSLLFHCITITSSSAACSSSNKINSKGADVWCIQVATSKNCAWNSVPCLIELCVELFQLTQHIVEYTDRLPYIAMKFISSVRTEWVVSEFLKHPTLPCSFVHSFWNVLVYNCYCWYSCCCLVGFFHLVCFPPSLRFRSLCLCSHASHSAAFSNNTYTSCLVKRVTDRIQVTVTDITSACIYECTV